MCLAGDGNVRLQPAYLHAFYCRNVFDCTAGSRYSIVLVSADVPEFRKSKKHYYGAPSSLEHMTSAIGMNISTQAEIVSLICSVQD